MMKTKKKVLIGVLAATVAVAITVGVVVVIIRSSSANSPAAVADRVVMVTDSENSTYKSIGISDARQKYEEDCEFKGYLLKVNDVKAWFMCYNTDIRMEGEDIKSVTYKFADGMGCIGTRKDWPDQVAKFYYNGETESDKGLRRFSNYLKVLDKYCRDNGTVPKRMVDDETGEIYMIKNGKNPVTYGYEEQPEHLYIFVNETEYKANADNGVLEYLINVSVVYTDDSSETLTYKIKADNDDSNGVISISKTDSQNV